MATPTSKKDPEQVVASFVSDNLSDLERSSLELELASFVVQHATHHRPVALVSSGGTAADLEVNSVRCLDNFSTGLRGAVSVEEFLRRGYAVIHLWRQGSAAPFGRVLGQLVGLKQANFGMDVEALGKLFAGQEHQGEEVDLVQQVLDQEADPWLTETNTANNVPSKETTAANTTSAGELSLHRQLLHSTKLQKALSERSLAFKEGRILTVPFRTIEEYLAKLKLAATALDDSGSLALIYLAAAVSDYYIPLAEKSQHKIQSTEGGNEGGITLQLRPVPKAMGLLRHQWASKAFLISFKLETDMAILRRKAEKAVQKYGCHMVIGNMLQTRHSKVWILAPPEGELEYYTATNNQQPPTPLHDWPFQEVAKPAEQQLSIDQDSLESAIIDYVVQSHFEFISHHGYFDNDDGMKSALQRRADLEDKKRQLRRQAFQDQVKGHAWAIAGTALAVVLSSAINSALQRRAANPR